MKRAEASLSHLSAALAALAVAAMPAYGLAAETCGLCDKRVVMNSDLAGCFLEEYGTLAQRSSTAVIVDLSDCESRGVVEALAPPVLEIDEPDVQFMLSRTQLDCLKRKLEEPGVVLDPSVTIELDQCS